MALIKKTHNWSMQLLSSHGVPCPKRRSCYTVPTLKVLRYISEEAKRRERTRTASQTVSSGEDMVCYTYVIFIGKYFISSTILEKQTLVLSRKCCGLKYTLSIYKTQPIYLYVVVSIIYQERQISLYVYIQREMQICVCIYLTISIYILIYILISLYQPIQISATY